AAAAIGLVAGEIHRRDRQPGAGQIERSAAGPQAGRAALASIASGGEPALAAAILEGPVAAPAADADAGEAALAAPAADRLVIREDDGRAREGRVSGVEQAAARPRAGRPAGAAVARSDSVVVAAGPAEAQGTASSSAADATLCQVR